MKPTKPHRIIEDLEVGKDYHANFTLATVHPAKAEVVDFVLSQPPGTADGRSEYVWVRLQNGDLILGVFPRGDTYFAVEEDARYPGE